MHPYLALLLYIAFISAVLRFDLKRHPRVSGAVWVPLIWMSLSGSRNPSQWLNLNQWGSDQFQYFQEYMGGNPTDRAVFLLLILAGLFILFRRRIDKIQLLKTNLMLFLFISYCLASLLWSDFPTVAGKRLVKATGDYIMVLVVLTETHFLENLEALIRRSGYILIPGSVLLMKYFPYGRIFSPWGGSEYTGVSTSKNMLGALCLIYGFYFIWSMVRVRKGEKTLYDRKEYYLYAFMLVMILWMLLKAPSMTSTLCLLFSVSMVLVLHFPAIRRNPLRIRFLVIYTAVFLTIIQFSADMIPDLLAFLGRDMTLTGRIPLWEQLTSMDINPVLGAGYESFWLGGRLEEVWSTHWWHPNQAHNGYLEIYLNLGWTGLILLGGVLYSTYRKAKRSLVENFQYGTFRMVALTIIIIFSLLEAAFKGLHIIWFLFLLAAMEYPTAPGDGESAPRLQAL
ncbi:MAG: O-antigen ligase family protein [bacterium]|nr:MAG: O-antigen ligase family protein [bacterium]